jgi:hypothetical protein
MEQPDHLIEDKYTWPRAAHTFGLLQTDTDVCIAKY